MKLKVHDTYKRYQKITTNFEAVNDEDVVNKPYLDEKTSKIAGHLAFSEKDYNEFKLQYNKQSVEEILAQRAVNTTIQILYDEGLFDFFCQHWWGFRRLFIYHKAKTWFRGSKWWHSMILFVIINKKIKQHQK